MSTVVRHILLGWVLVFIGLSCCMGHSIQNMDAIVETSRYICGVVVFNGSLCSGFTVYLHFNI